MMWVSLGRTELVSMEARSCFHSYHLLRSIGHVGLLLQVQNPCPIFSVSSLSSELLVGVVDDDGFASPWSLREKRRYFLGVSFLFSEWQWLGSWAVPRRYIYLLIVV